jgi:hypothetical protein
MNSDDYFSEMPEKLGRPSFSILVKERHIHGLRIAAGAG